ncbi:MAG: hypothetical protein ABWY13_01775 [Mesorhizobium sp.]|jgi:hypothetical protein
MNKARLVFTAGSIAAVAFLAGCMSGGPGGGPFGGARGVEGEWLSTDGVAVSRFNGGVFETVATDTGNKLANGSYQMVDARTVTINGTSLIRQSPISFNCSMATSSQLNCTSSTGQQFVLTRRQAATS